MGINSNSHVKRPGLAIAPNDIIRNYLLDKLPESEKLHVYSEYWLRLELITKTSLALDKLFEEFLIHWN